ncbi:hypothetical protein BYT27DRAFT_7254018 [Phlegmacium glaucopus]|nr:hypothetical protein BYT27DRAFT_7254018 [Phlegmacium glaucopus]
MPAMLGNGTPPEMFNRSFEGLLHPMIHVVEFGLPEILRRVRNIPGTQLNTNMFHPLGLAEANDIDNELHESVSEKALDLNFRIACSAHSSKTAVSPYFSALSALYQMTFAGFSLHLNSIPPLLRWLQWLCPLKYNLEGLGE